MGISESELATDLLKTIAQDDLCKAVLDREVSRKWLKQRKLALVSGSVECLSSALDPVRQTTFALDRQRPDDLIDAGRGGVFNRRSG